MRILHAALVATGLLVAGAGCTQGQSSAGVSVPYTVLDDQASQLRADFNAKIGSVRLLFVVDPICPGCLRGLADMNRDLLRSTSDPRLRTFVVHEPVLGIVRYAPWLRPSGGKDVPKAAQLLQNPNIQHYWNSSGAFGRLLSQAVGLKNGETQVYAWDVWLIYGPEAKWLAPIPRVLASSCINCAPCAAVRSFPIWTVMCLRSKYKRCLRSSHRLQLRRLSPIGPINDHDE